MADGAIRIVRVQRPASASGPWYLHDEQTGAGAFIDPAPEFESAMADNSAYFEAERTANGVWRLLKPARAPT
jgi:hypothetical protein